MRYEFNIQPEAFEFEEEASEFEARPVESPQHRGSGDYIRWLQRALNQVLGANLAVDGRMGPQTRSAVRAFQQNRRLAVDGIVGPRTEAALIFAGAGAPSVRWVQSMLNKILGLRLVEDGIVGPQTRSAIRSFEQKHGAVGKQAGVIGQLFDPRLAWNLLCTLACLACAGSIPLPPPGDEAFWCTVCFQCAVSPPS